MRGWDPHRQPRGAPLEQQPPAQPTSKSIPALSSLLKRDICQQILTKKKEKKVRLPMKKHNSGKSRRPHYSLISSSVIIPIVSHREKKIGHTQT